jgi:putative ABC transport system permease protein
VGQVLLVIRLVLADVRRHPGQAAVLLLSITVATAMLGLGGSLGGATDTLYRQTRDATAGPDVVALSAGDGPDATLALTSLADAPEVADRSGPYRQYYATLTANGSAANVVVQGAPVTPGPVDRPLVTSGSWVRTGGVVVERGFARALGVHVGDSVAVAGRSLPIVGIAVTAAYTVYPWAELTGPDGGPSDYSGLVWLAEPDTRALAADHPVTSLLYLKLRDPNGTQAFVDSYRDPMIRVNLFTWQFMSTQNSVLLRGSQPILVIGSWLLSFLAIAGVATLAAGRAAKQTRRVGLLKAVGAEPGLIATVLLAEYLTLALLANALGWVVARLVEPAIVNPSGSLLTTATGPAGSTIVFMTVVALAVPALTTLGPTVQALRTETVAALADTAHRPQHQARLTRLSALLPVPLLLGLRLVARRPGRAVLHACSTAATLTACTALLMILAQPSRSYGLGSSALSNLRDDQGRHLLLAVTAALITLAAVNTITSTWATALEARPTIAIARTLGATPGQITAGLSTAQLLPTLPGAVAGIPVGITLCLLLTPGHSTMPPAWWLFAAALAAPLATAALTALPARIAAHRSVARTLSAEAS